MLNNKMKSGLVVASTLAMVALGSPAMAAVAAADVTAAFTGITADAATIFGEALPIVGTVLGLSVGIALFKKFGNKAA